MSQIKVTFLFLLTFLSWSIYSQNKYVIDKVKKVNGLYQDHREKLYFRTDHKICTWLPGGEEADCKEYSKKVVDFLKLNDLECIVAFENSIALFKKNILLDSVRVSSRINKIRASEKAVYIATNGNGLYVWNIESRTLDSIPSLSGLFINDIIINHDFLWVALDESILKFSTSDFSKVNETNFSETLIDKLIMLNNQLVVTTQFGKIRLLQEDLNQEKSISLKERIQAISVNGNSLFALTSIGCYEVTQDFTHELIIEGEFESVKALDNVLFLTNSNKIIEYNLTQKVIQRNIESTAVYAESDSSLWIGSKGKVFQFNGSDLIQTVRVQTANEKKLIISSLMVLGERLYVGTMGQGLFIFNKRGDLLKRYFAEGGNSQRNIIQLKRDENKLWIVFLNGLTSISLAEELNSEGRENQNMFIENHYLYNLSVVDSTTLFVGTSLNGLIKIGSDQSSNILKGSSVLSLKHLGDTIYFGTESRGVFSLANSQDSKPKQIVEVNNVFGITKVKDKLLLIKENELQLFDPKTNDLIPLTESGVKNVQFNAISETEASVYIGYENGVLQLNKERLSKISNTEVYFEELKLFDRSISEEKQTFDYDQNTFTFSFNSSRYYNPRRTIYKYRLVGLDSTWQTTSQHFINYYNLNPGKYTFELTVGSSQAFTPVSKKAYSFTIKKPFWLTFSFISVSLIALLGLVYYLVKSREKRLLAKSKQEQERLKFDFDQLKNQVDPHFLFNSLNSLIGVIEEDPKVAVKSVTKLSNVYRAILEYSSLDTIDLDTELTLAEQYFEIHKLRYQHLINLEIDNSFKNDYRLVPLSCQFLIENAIKHNQISKRNNLKIRIYQDKDYLVVVNNINAKISPEQSTSLGLVNLKKRYAQLTDQEVVIKSDQDYFTVKLPMIHG